MSALRLSALLAILGCAEDAPPARPSTPRGVVLHTSADARTWTRVPGYVDAHLETLGLSVRPDGTLWVTGLVFGLRPGLWEQYISGPPVRGLTFDGDAWRPQEWWVSDPGVVNYIDPQWLDDELWFVSRPGRGGDPAEHGANNTVRSTPPPTERLALASVTDPSPARFKGELLLFLTAAGQVQLWAGEPLRLRRSWKGVTVPYAVAVGDELWLYAQAAGPRGRRPVVSRSTDGHAWSGFDEVLPASTEGSCTSPVMGPHPKGGWLLLCVEESQR